MKLTVGKAKVVSHGKTMGLHGMVLAIIETTNVGVHEVGNSFLWRARHDCFRRARKESKWESKQKVEKEVESVEAEERER